MMKEIKFALYAMKKNVQGSAELRSSFLLNMFGMMLNNSAFVLLWVFFAKSSGGVGGWTPDDVIGLLGYAMFSYGVVFSFAHGLRFLPDHIASGDFDKFMLSPKNIIIRTSTSSFNPSAFGDILFGLSAVLVYLVLISATWLQIFFATIFVLSSCLIFFSVTLAIISLGFLFTDASPVTRSLFELFITPSLFHGGAFQGVVRFAFIFLMPSLAIGTLPVEIIKSVSTEGVLLVLALAIGWMLFSVKLFYTAIKRYESSNLMTFGG